MADDMSGAIVLGLVGSAVGVFAVNYLMSDPGQSWFDQIKDKVSSKEEPAPTPDTTPVPQRALPQRATRQLGPRSPIPPPGVRQPVVPQVRRPATRPAGPAYMPTPAPPLTITVEMVREAASRLNALLHLNLPTTGVITADLSQAVKQMQQQFGLPVTGFPDGQTLNHLRGFAAPIAQLAAPAAQAARRVAPELQKVAPLLTQATNFISKTFGGPPSSASTGPDEGVRSAQKMLNTILKTDALTADGIMGPKTAGALKEFQASHGLPQTGTVDSKTHDALESAASGPGFFDRLFKTGADAGDWKSETQSLGDAGQNVISKALDEGDLRTLRSLGRALKGAGFPQAAAACDAKAKAGSSGSSGSSAPATHAGYYAGFYGW